MRAALVRPTGAGAISPITSGLSDSVAWKKGARGAYASSALGRVVPANHEAEKPPLASRSRRGAPGKATSDRKYKKKSMKPRHPEQVRRPVRPLHLCNLHRHAGETSALSGPKRRRGQRRWLRSKNLAVGAVRRRSVLPPPRPRVAPPPSTHWRS